MGKIDPSHKVIFEILLVCADQFYCLWFPDITRIGASLYYILQYHVGSVSWDNLGWSDNLVRFDRENGQEYNSRIIRKGAINADLIRKMSSPSDFRNLISKKSQNFQVLKNISRFFTFLLTSKFCWNLEHEPTDRKFEIFHRNQPYWRKPSHVWPQMTQRNFICLQILILTDEIGIAISMNFGPVGYLPEKRYKW